jgi:tetratricopeptide (TPR) repeat protein
MGMNTKAPDPFIKDKFIGRRDQINTYEQWLTTANAPGILYFHDAAPEPDKKGGVGKTRLLQECIKVTKERHKEIAIVNVDFFSIMDRNGKTIAERVYRQLRNTYLGWSADSFDRALKDGQNNANPVEIRNKLSEALTADLHDLDAYLGERYPKRLRTLLIVLDTFEVIQDNPSVAVFSPIQKFPDNYHFDRIRFLMAGRNVINWAQPNWQGREHEVRSVALEPFNRDETVNYMHSYSIRLEPGSPEAAMLWELTGGRPILLGLVKDLVGLNTVKLKDLLSVSPAKFEAHLVSQINHIDKPINWLLLFMAHAYHRFNSALLTWMLQESHLQELVGETDGRQLETLPNISFLRRSADGSGDFTLHDEMRPLIMKYCWESLDTNESFRREVSRCVIQYYEDALKQGHDDLMLQSYIVQILYHKAFLDIKDGLQYFTQHFNNAIDLWQNAYARTLLQEIQKFTDSLSAHQRADMVMEEARLFLKEENREMALAYYKQIQDEAEEDWVEAHQAELCYNLGECYLALAEFQEASSSFNAALTLERKGNNQKAIADILNALGYISRCQGWFDQAVECYQESFRIYKDLGQQSTYRRELADILNNLANAYRLLGKINEALIYGQRGLQVREKLSRNHEVSEVAVGFSHATLGYIYLCHGKDRNAEYHLKIAFDAFTRTNNKRGLAACNNRFGMIQMRSGKMDDALNSFKKAFEEATYIDEEAQITSLNKQGHIYALHEEYEKARSTFEQAVPLAIRVDDSYQEVESRIGLARTLANLKEYGPYSQQLERAATIAKQRSYNKLLGEIEKLQGEQSYQQKKYQDAFLHYAIFCHFMAEYNLFEYHEALRFLIGELLTMDDPGEVVKALRVLCSYWEEQQLANTHPEVLRVCDSVDEVNL